MKRAIVLALAAILVAFMVGDRSAKAETIYLPRVERPFWGTCEWPITQQQAADTFQKGDYTPNLWFSWSNLVFPDDGQYWLYHGGPTTWISFPESCGWQLEWYCNNCGNYPPHGFWNGGPGFIDCNFCIIRRLQQPTPPPAPTAIPAPLPESRKLAFNPNHICDEFGWRYDANHIKADDGYRWIIADTSQHWSPIDKKAFFAFDGEVENIRYVEGTFYEIRSDLDPLTIMDRIAQEYLRDHPGSWVQTDECFGGICSYRGEFNRPANPRYLFYDPFNLCRTATPVATQTRTPTVTRTPRPTATLFPTFTATPTATDTAVPATSVPPTSLPPAYPGPSTPVACPNESEILDPHPQRVDEYWWRASDVLAQNPYQAILFDGEEFRYDPQLSVIRLFPNGYVPCWFFHQGSWRQICSTDSVSIALRAGSDKVSRNPGMWVRVYSCTPTGLGCAADCTLLREYNRPINCPIP